MLGFLQVVLEILYFSDDFIGLDFLWFTPNLVQFRSLLDTV